MKTTAATTALAALAQPTRLEVFRLMMRCAPDGCTAGDIAAKLEVPPATLSFHLKHLEQAGLVRSRRASRHIVYSADLAGARDLVRFLTEDCCGGRPEICGGLEIGQTCEPAPEHQDRSQTAIIEPEPQA
jgi:DNA-binding transcriptional ArsR family regulator